MKKIRKQMHLFLIFLFLFTGFALPRSVKKDVSINLVEKGIKDLDISGLTLVFYVNITNSSSSPYFLSGYEYRFVVNQIEYIRLQTSLEKAIKIEAKGNTLISFPLKITYAHLYQAVQGIEESNKGSGYLTGTMRFSDGKKEKGKLPFSFSGELPIFKKPGIEFISIKVKDLTIGGADISFELSFKNSNTFELLVDKISYNLYLGDIPIGEGIISGDKNIESQGEKVFSLPLLLNFFEIGKEAYYALRQPYILSRFYGEIEVRTIWGKIKIPLDKSEKIAVVKPT